MAEPGKKTVYELIPQLGKLRDEVLFGDVWGLVCLLRQSHGFCCADVGGTGDDHIRQSTRRRLGDRGIPGCRPDVDAGGARE